MITWFSDFAICQSWAMGTGSPRASCTCVYVPDYEVSTKLFRSLILAFHVEVVANSACQSWCALLRCSPSTWMDATVDYLHQGYRDRDGAAGPRWLRTRAVSFVAVAFWRWPDRFESLRTAMSR